MADALYAILNFVGYAHPFHTVITHLIIGPVIGALLVHLFALIMKKPHLFKTARHLTVLGFIFWFPTVLVGVLDWIYYSAASPDMIEIKFKSIGAGLVFVTLLSSIILFKKKVKENSRAILALYVASAALLAVIGYFGGDIVYANAGHQATANIVVPEVAEDGTKSFAVDQFEVEYRIENGTIHTSVAYPTEGWVGIGFGQTGTMQGSHIILGYVDRQGEAQVSDDFGYAHTKHASKEELGRPNALVDTGASLENGVTTIWFSMPLVSPDPDDPVLVEGEEVSVILARSGRADFTSYHGNADSGGHYTVKIRL